MNGDTREYENEEIPRLKSTRRGKRIWAGNFEVGAGDAAGKVAGGSDGVKSLEEPLVLTMAPSI